MTVQVKVDQIEIRSFKQDEDAGGVYDATVVFHVLSDLGSHEFRVPVNGAPTLDDAVNNARRIFKDWAENSAADVKRLTTWGLLELHTPLIPPTRLLSIFFTRNLA